MVEMGSFEAIGAQETVDPLARWRFKAQVFGAGEMNPMGNYIQDIEKVFTRTDHPNFRAGDTLRVHFRIKEGQKERTQIFQGVCIALKRGAHAGTITVRKVSFGHGVERIFPLSSPRIEKIEVLQRGKVRRAKLYYLRGLRGKKARIRERTDWGKKSS